MNHLTWIRGGNAVVRRGLRFGTILAVLALAPLLVGCAVFGSDMEPFDFHSPRADVSDATQRTSDLFTCKKYDEKTDTFDEITDIFGVGDDILLVVATLPPDEKLSRMVVEMITPDDEAMLPEMRRYRSGSQVAIRYNISDLIREGGYGAWRVNLYGDTLPIDYTDFWILEHPELGIPDEADPDRPAIEGKYILKP